MASREGYRPIEEAEDWEAEYGEEARNCCGIYRFESRTKKRVFIVGCFIAVFLVAAFMTYFVECLILENCDAVPNGADDNATYTGVMDSSMEKYGNSVMENIGKFSGMLDRIGNMTDFVNKLGNSSWTLEN